MVSSVHLENLTPLQADEWVDALAAAMLVLREAEELGRSFETLERFHPFTALDAWDSALANLMAIADTIWRWRKDATRRS
jgi:hypothetical protein